MCADKPSAHVDKPLAVAKLPGSSASAPHSQKQVLFITFTFTSTDTIQHHTDTMTICVCVNIAHTTQMMQAYQEDLSVSLLCGHLRRDDTYDEEGRCRNQG